ncbi:RNA polymerase sigma factor [Sediminicurvatus halobius]|uniref:RNA polymerase sigma factor n=1 Tax=Sediminicurvatus halobius TaxID=2182432 RepID=A0A2U2MWZ1_9GAMM|nr:RNA polymerase sigma factor [Spiribacter halobius]PWG61385.1 RNA polymerase sigma factor [Spiribacter halobius]UEX76598.1 RNA polymerase sigma factor [Spiribacter halobius]
MTAHIPAQPAREAAATRTVRQPTGLPGPAQLPDERVVARVRAGEVALFELIMRRYNRRLFRIARSILPDDAEAEDAVQDGYIRAYFQLAQFRGPEGFASWLCRIVRNEALMRLRRRAPASDPLSALERPAHREAATADPCSPTANPEAALHEAQLQRLLEAAIDELPEPFRSAFVLREVEQLSVAETAACLGVEPATVKTRVHRARLLLQRNMTAEVVSLLPRTFAFDGARCDRLVGRVFERLGVSARQWR